MRQTVIMINFAKSVAGSAVADAMLLLATTRAKIMTLKRQSKDYNGNAMAGMVMQGDGNSITVQPTMTK